MTDTLEYEVQISQHRDTVWVHCSDGSTVGRFGIGGIDIHTTVTEQLNGASQCRMCGPHKSAGSEDWDFFREKAKEFWNVDIPSDSFCLERRIMISPNVVRDRSTEELNIP